MDYSTTYTEASALGGILGVLAGFLIIIILIAIVLVVLDVIGTWKVLKKAGQPGWAAIIPYYSQYCQCKVNGLTPWWVLIFAIASIISSSTSNSDSVSILAILASIVTLYYKIVNAISMSRSFGKSDGYAVGLILLEPFFIFALGIGKSQYVGPKPVDPIMGAIIKNNDNNSTNTNVSNMNNNQTMNNAQPVNQPANNNVENNNMVNNTPVQSGKVCPGCGANVVEGQQFCQNCGRQIQ